MQRHVLTLVCISVFSLCLCFPLAHTQGVPNPSEMTVSQYEGASPYTLDPAAAYDTVSGELIQNVYETLVFYDREKLDQFVPMLATNWTISPDGLTYTFKVRGTDGNEPPVKFHNDHTLTTEDVEYSFERTLVYDVGGGPAWTLYEPLLNRFSSRDEVGNIVVTAEQIDSAIARTATTVTFHLAIPYPPFLQILSQTWSAILSKDWCISLGDWPGTWDNWQNYNDQPSPIDLQDTEAPGPHLNAMCGTGPYYLEHVDHTLQEWLIQKFDEYWHGWPAAGANGFLESVRQTWRGTWPERRDMFLAGQADEVRVTRTYIGEVLGQPGVRCVYPLAQLSCSVMSFNFRIAGSSPYMGVPGGLPPSTLEENGIPPDFFTNTDVRKGFAYSINYTALIDELLLGEAYQPATPIIWGLPFYNPTQEKYSVDLAKAEEHFRAAWAGELWTEGFTLTLCYPEGNILGGLMLHKISETVKANVESLNPKFHVNVVSLSGSEYASRRAHGEMLIRMTGWVADFSDPHDFAVGFMYSQGSIAKEQGYKNATMDALVESGIRETDIDQRRQIYYELQSLYHDDCPGVPLVQTRGRHFERDWLQGWYYNPLYSGDYYYPLWKEEFVPAQVAPGSNTIDAVQASDTLILMDTTGVGNVSVAKYVVNVKGTTTEDTVAVKYLTVDTDLAHSEIVFPIELRIYYTNEQILSAYVDQSTLLMYSWNDTTHEWTLEPNSGWVTPSDVPGYSGYVWAKIYHLSVFASMGKLKSAAPTPPVGGEWAAPNQLELPVLWISLASTVAIAASFVGFRRIRKRRD